MFSDVNPARAQAAAILLVLGAVANVGAAIPASRFETTEPAAETGSRFTWQEEPALEESAVVEPGSLPTAGSLTPTTEFDLPASTDYVLGSEDLLDIQVVGVESLTRIVRISDAGKITLPLLGEVHAAGLSRTALERDLAVRLEENYLNDPQVSVFIKEYGSKMVSVLGAVERPGRYAMTSRRTLLDLISEAGGLEDDAAPFAVVTRQPTNPEETRETLRVDLDALLYGDRPDLNMEIARGDMIHIPRDRPVFVYVNGAVNRPGEFETPRSRPLTLLQAIAKAGGTTDRAAVRKVQLLRRKDDGSQETIAIDLKAVMRGELEDPVLQSGDVVVVQETYF